MTSIALWVWCGSLTPGKSGLRSNELGIFCVHFCFSLGQWFQTYSAQKCLSANGLLSAKFWNPVWLINSIKTYYRMLLPINENIFKVDPNKDKKPYKWTRKKCFEILFFSSRILTLYWTSKTQILNIRERASSLLKCLTLEIPFQSSRNW